MRSLVSFCGWIAFAWTLVLGGCAAAPQGNLTPSGVWVETRPPSTDERLAYVSEDTICGPSGTCEAVLEWTSDTVTTEKGSYDWALQRDGSVLRVCQLPCSVTLDAEETGAVATWSELTQSYGWAGWGRLP
jgi:hypothetical protein